MHASLGWLFRAEKTGRLDRPLVGALTLGGITHLPLIDRAWGRMVMAGLVPTGQNATMSKARSAVRSISDSRVKSF
jgi:hypothetical protein